MSFCFFDCNKTKVIIEGKCKNVMLQKCKRMDISIDSTMALCEVLKCDAIKVRVQKNVRTVNIEHSIGVQVFPSVEAKSLVSLVVTASQSISMTFPRAEGSYDKNDPEENTEK